MIESFIERPEDDASTDREGKGEISRWFTIKTRHDRAPVANSQAMLDLALRARPDLRPFSVHPDRRDAFVTQPRVSRESKWLWQMSVPYSTDIPTDEWQLKDREGKRQDPTDRRAKVSISTRAEKVIITKDIDGHVLANTAGDPFPDVEDEEYLLEVNVSKNVRKIESEWLLKYPNSVNEEEMKFLGVPFPPKTLLCTSVVVGILETEVVNGSPVDFHPLSYHLAFREKGWIKELLNTGFRERHHEPGQDPRLEKITDRRGDPIDEPVFLDYEGAAYRVGVPAATQTRPPASYKQPLRCDLTSEEIITLKFEIKRVLPFKKLPHK